MRLVMLAILSSCVTLPREDYSIPVREANYLSAQFEAKESTFLGAGEVRIMKNSNLSELDLNVQGYLDGTVRVDSEACGVNQSFTYKNNEKVKINLSGKAVKSCLFKIIVQPDKVFFNEMEGRLLVKVLDENKGWVGQSNRIPSGANAKFLVPVIDKSPSNVVFFGCGVKYEKLHYPTDGFIELNLEDFSVDRNRDYCPLEGVILQPHDTVYVSWSIHHFKDGFSPLPLPNIEHIESGSITVSFDESIAYSLEGGKTSNDLIRKIKYDPSKEYSFQALTRKGRTILCEWWPNASRWVCLN